MIKQIAWNTFKNTGNIDTYMEFVELKNVEGTIVNNEKKDIINNINKVNNYEEYKNKGINITGK